MRSKSPGVNDFSGTAVGGAFGSLSFDTVFAWHVVVPLLQRGSRTSGGGGGSYFPWRPCAIRSAWTAPRTGEATGLMKGEASRRTTHQPSVQPGPGALVTSKRVISTGTYQVLYWPIYRSEGEAHLVRHTPGLWMMRRPLYFLRKTGQHCGGTCTVGTQRAQYYCRCGTRLAKDNTERQCARCQRDSRDKLIAPPDVPDEFWETEQFEEAFAAQHMGWVSRVYRTHPYHHAVYGSSGISQTLLGQWIGLRQPHVSRFETGPPIRHLDTLQHWARVLRIPSKLLWFDMPSQTRLIVSGGRRDEVVLPADAENLQNTVPPPAPSPSAHRILLPLVVDGQSLLLPLAEDVLAESGLGNLVRRLPISNSLPADGFPPTVEFLSPDIDFDELHHVAAVLADAHRYMDGSVTDYFRRQLDACEADDGARGPTKALPIVLGILCAIEKRVRDVPPAVRHELLSIGARRCRVRRLAVSRSPSSSACLLLV